MCLVDECIKKVDSLYFDDNSENQSRSCRPIWQMKMHIDSNILPKFVGSATIYCRVMAMLNGDFTYNI